MRICSRVLASREVECTALYQPSQNVLFFLEEEQVQVWEQWCGI